MTRDQIIAHLTLHGWVPVMNGASERGVRLPDTGRGFLAYYLVDHQGVQIMSLTNSLASWSSIKELDTWANHSDEELVALQNGVRAYERC